MKIELFSGRVIKRISIAIGLFFLMGLLLTGGLLGLISHPDLVGDLVDMPTGNSLVPDVRPLPRCRPERSRLHPGCGLVGHGPKGVHSAL